MPIGRGSRWRTVEPADMEGPVREAVRLIATQRWFALATVDLTGVPFLSYVPFAAVDGAFGVVLSGLAAHTANLLAHPSAAVLLVDDDVGQRDAYARARFSVSVTPHPNAPGSSKADAIWSALEGRQGATVRTLRTLPDFQAFSLEPVSGRLVLGFASAHDVDATAIAGMLQRARAGP